MSQCRESEQSIVPVSQKPLNTGVSMKEWEVFINNCSYEDSHQLDFSISPTSNSAALTYFERIESFGSTNPFSNLTIGSMDEAHFSRPTSKTMNHLYSNSGELATFAKKVEDIWDNKSTNIANPDSSNFSSFIQTNSVWSASQEEQKSEENFNSPSMRHKVMNFDSFEGLECVEPSQCDDHSDTPTKVTKNSKKHTRWRKTDDSKLFQLYTEVITASNMDLFKFTQFLLDEKNLMVCQDFITRCQWRGHAFSLCNRIKKLLKDPKSLSEREEKLLRKTYYLQLKSGKVNWNKIYYLLPGKDQLFIKETCQHFKRASNLQLEASTHFYSCS